MTKKEVIAVTKLSDESSAETLAGDPEWMAAEQERVAIRVAEEATRVKDPDHRITKQTAKKVCRAMVVYAD